jgi:hypothetical protein
VADLLSCLQFKYILQKIVNQTGRSWTSKLSEALWAYRMAYKMPVGMTPYQLVYGKTWHILIELEHKAFWAIRMYNMVLKAMMRIHSRQMANALNYSLSKTPRILRKWMSLIFLS